MKKRFRTLIFALLALAPLYGHAAASRIGNDGSWQRVTAHINGVFSPRGFFNLLVGFYSVPTIKSAQFNLGQSTILLDFPPDVPAISKAQLQNIEKTAGYRPGPIETQYIPARDFAENGPGWIKIKHTKSKHALGWFKQNF